MKKKKAEKRESSRRTFRMMCYPDQLGAPSPDRAMTVIKHRLDHIQQVKQYAFVVHNSDKWTIDDLDKHYPVDPETGQRKINQRTGKPYAVGDDKEIHIHVDIWLNVRWRRRQLADAINLLSAKSRLTERNFMPMDDERGALEYLTHRNRPDKTQYDDDAVVANFDWKALRDGEKRMSELDGILQKIETGEITKTNIAQKLTMSQYVKYKAKLQDAFWFYDQQHKHDKNSRLCIYVTSGVAGSGKSTLAEMLAKVIASKHGWDYTFGGNGKDVWGDYNGEEILILDDKSFGDMGRDSWLNTFDRFVKGSMDSRFKNKNATNIRLIIVTNILPFDENVGKIKDLSDDEDKSQFARRFQLVANVQEDVITLYRYNDSTKGYEVHEKINNHLTAYIRQAGDGNAEAMLSEVTDAVRAIQHEAKIRLNPSGQDAQEIEDSARLEDGPIEL